MLQKIFMIRVYETCFSTVPLQVQADLHIKIAIIVIHAYIIPSDLHP